MEGARKLVDVIGNVQAAETVLIVTDTEKLEIAHPVATAAISVGANVTITVMTPLADHGSDPPGPVAAAMSAADVVFAATTVSLFHSRARQQATEIGVRFCNMVDYRPWMLRTGGLRADFLAMVPLVERLSSDLSRAKNVHVTSPAGTDITFSIDGREGMPQRGVARAPGQVCSPPDIEAAAGPVEGTANGVIVVDGSIPHRLIGVVDEPIRLTLESGQVTQVEGGYQAGILSQLWAAYGTASVYNLAELGLGLNPEARICGAMLEDEGAYGTVHFGFGDNRSYGGNVAAPLHLDAVIRQPTLRLDGQTILMDGEIVERADTPGGADQ
jgi:leucyl aminopeptidase (aminopeptidase T)